MKATKDKKASGAINSVNCHNSLVKYTRNERSIDLLFQSHARPPLPSLNCRVLAVDFVNSQDSRVVRFRLHYVLLSAALFLPSSLPHPRFPASGTLTLRCVPPAVTHTCAHSFALSQSRRLTLIQSKTRKHAEQCLDSGRIILADLSDLDFRNPISQSEGADCHRTRRDAR